MTRNRKSAKTAGTRFETAIAQYLAEQLDDDRIERRRLGGRLDRGDIAGLRHHGQRLVIEAKDYGGRLLPAQWIEEAHVEAGNDSALCGLVVAKRRGTTNPGTHSGLWSYQAAHALRVLAREQTDDCGTPNMLDLLDGGDAA